MINTSTTNTSTTTTATVDSGSRMTAAAPTTMAGRHVSRGGPASRYRRVERPTGAERPNYVLRRCSAALVSIVAVLAIAVVVNGVLASFGGRPASAADARPAQQAASAGTHVARSGDTLWSIASAYRGAVEHGEYVDALIRLNGDAGIALGQAVILP